MFSKTITVKIVKTWESVEKDLISSVKIVSGHEPYLCKDWGNSKNFVRQPYSCQVHEISFVLQLNFTASTFKGKQIIYK